MAPCNQKRSHEVDADLRSQASQHHAPVTSELSQQAVARDAVRHLGELLDGKDRRGGHEEDESNVKSQVNQQKFKPHAIGDNALARVVIGHRPCARLVGPAHFGMLFARRNGLAVFGHQVFHGLFLRIAC